TVDTTFVSNLFQHCHHVSRLHEIVAELHRDLSPLGVDPWRWTLSATTIHEEADKYLLTIERADRARIAIENCPLKSRLLNCLKENSSQALASLMEKFRESCVRSALDNRARTAIAPLYEYLDDDFRADVESRIEQQRGLLPAIETLCEKFGTVPAIQRFRFFRSRLPENCGPVFDVLADAS